jgi:hypothetical protein
MSFTFVADAAQTTFSMASSTAGIDDTHADEGYTISGFAVSGASAGAAETRSSRSPPPTPSRTRRRWGAPRPMTTSWCSR